jgi:hypothetical protein
MVLFVITANHVVAFLPDPTSSPAFATPLPPVPCTGHMSLYQFS